MCLIISPKRRCVNQLSGRPLGLFYIHVQMATDLFPLVHTFLKEQGLDNVAEMLKTEAKLVFHLSLAKPRRNFLSRSPKRVCWIFFKTGKGFLVGV